MKASCSRDGRPGQKNAAGGRPAGPRCGNTHNCYKTKSMFILNAKKIKKFNDTFSDKKINSISDIYKKFKKDLNFLKINYGHYLLFNQNLPHGNLINKTNETRVSLNCRFKGLFSPYHQKELGSFFSPLKLRAATKLGLDYKMPGEK